MKKYLLLILFFIFSLRLFSQGQGDTWCFGDSSIMHFANSQATALPYCAMISYETSSSISDKNGNLLFYAGGYDQNSFLLKIWNSNHQVMQNGDSLYGFSSSSNGTLIVPFTDDSNKFYLFQQSFFTTPTFHLYYSIIDMGLNGGLGAVAQKNILLNNNNMAEKLAVVKHGNGKDWWLTAHPQTGSSYYIYLIDSNGIHSPLIQTIGKTFTNVTPEIGPVGEMTFSPDGSKMIAVSNQMIDYFEFDRCSGNLFNYQDISPLIPTANDFFYGTSFSPDNSKLYVSTISSLATNFPLSQANLSQFDLSASNIKQSRITLDSIVNSYITFGQHQLGSDGKIYVSFARNSAPVMIFDSTNMFLNTIENPDFLGLSCNFNRYTLYLNGHRTFAGLPNIPNYNLGALIGSACDTLRVGVEEHLLQSNISIYPNPSKGVINLVGNLNNGKLILRDITGRIVISKNISTINNFSSVNISELQDGVYFYSVYNGKELLKEDRLIILK